MSPTPRQAFCGHGHTGAGEDADCHPACPSSLCCRPASDFKHVTTPLLAGLCSSVSESLA